jgi:hypothetical protein
VSIGICSPKRISSNPLPRSCLSRLVRIHYEIAVKELLAMTKMRSNIDPSSNEQDPSKTIQHYGTPPSSIRR